jgi:hypothetical protein
MPFLSPSDPSLRPLIAYIVARARDHEITLNRTKLVKLLYLVDVERVRLGRKPLTGLTWVFYHYGPYAFELIDVLEAMEGGELAADQWQDSVLYRAAYDAPEGDEWPAGTKATVDSVMKHFAPLELNELLDHVYFQTGPMVDARRGDELDLSLARDFPPRFREPPLEPPTQPADIEERLRRWRESTARRFRPLTLDPPGSFFDDPADDLDAAGVRGTLHVPEGTEL